MKKVALFAMFALIGLQTISAQDTQGKRQRAIIKEWGGVGQEEEVAGKKNKFANPAASSSQPNSLKQDLANVAEAGEVMYLNVVAFTLGKADKTAFTPIADAAKARLIVVFKVNTEWAAPLAKGQLKLNNDKLNAILEAHGLYIDKFYGVADDLDGLVLRSKGAVSNIEKAAKELSLIEGIAQTLVKVKK